MVICRDGRARLDADKHGNNFPGREATPLRRPMVDFDIPARARPLARPETAAPALPPPPLHQCPAPPSTPPRHFTQPPALLPPSLTAIRPASQATPLAPPPHLGANRAAAQATPHAPPLDHRDRLADVHGRARRQRATRLEHPGGDGRPAPALSPPARPPPKPNRHDFQCTDAVLETCTPENIPQGEHTSLMQPQPLAGVHPFSPTLRE